MSTVEIKVPELGESITEATIAGWSKAEGEAVEADEIIVELETDKVTQEIPAPVSGVIKSIAAQNGATVGVGEVIAVIEAGATAEAAAPAPAESPQEAAAPAATPAEAAPQPSGPVNETLMPAVRKLVAENNLVVAQIKGSGRNGQITKEDVLAFMKDGAAKAAPAAPASAPAAAAPKAAAKPAVVFDGPEEEKAVPMSRLRQAIASRLVEAQHTAAILTTFNEVDMSAVMNIRKQYKDRFKEYHEVGLGFMSFFTKAVIEALKAYPAVNAEIRGGDIIYKNFYHIGIAVGGPRGLVVPVVRHADKLDFAGIEKEIMRLAGRVKEGSIGIDEMQGGTFTITNGGIFGSMLSTPILNPPQTGILGMHNIVERPMVVNGEIVARPMMYVALSYDHRLIDGREAVLFLVKIKECLEDPARMLLGV